MNSTFAEAILGGWPSFGFAFTTTKEAAPPFTEFEGWATRIARSAWSRRLASHPSKSAMGGAPSVVVVSTNNETWASPQNLARRGHALEPCVI